MHGEFRDVPVQNKTALKPSFSQYQCYPFNTRIHSLCSGIIREQKLLALSDTKQAIKIQNTQFHSELLPNTFCLFY